jgi:hypothetical protein
MVIAQKVKDNRGKRKELEVNANWGSTPETSPAWRRLWQLLLSPGSHSAMKGEKNECQSAGPGEDTEEDWKGNEETEERKG